MEGERKKEEEEQSYPLVSPPEVDLLVPITFRWIILVEIIDIDNPYEDYWKEKEEEEEEEEEEEGEKKEKEKKRKKKEKKKKKKNNQKKDCIYIGKLKTYLVGMPALM